MHDPVISNFPTSIYRLPLFVHPPLLPAVLKAGEDFLGDPVIVGLAFANLGMGLMLLCAGRAMTLLSIPPRWSIVAFLGIVFCPLLLFSTTRLHTDGLLGILLACGLIAFIDAVDKRSMLMAAFSGALIAAAMNSRYTGITAVPLVVLFQGYQLFRLSAHSQHEYSGTSRISAFRNELCRPQNWYAFGIVMAIVFTIGMQHYYRILATYGHAFTGRFQCRGRGRSQV